MKPTLVLVLGAALATASIPAVAQPAADPGATPNPAVHDASTMTGQPLAQGHNSFTRDQAAARIQAAGFTDVANLSLDAQGLWQGTAMRNGASVRVALDYKGNVATQ
jgi:hypothetical protein